ncbi:MAG: DNA-binding protein [Clostridiales bacterium]|jgi:predicted DNA-binding protein YlxM (UPF0122 family)|nr:DNA-binding protein [Clostridiales bacterium]
MSYVKNLEIGELNGLYGGILTERQREFLRLYYDCDMSLFEISDLFGVSRQAVRDAIVRGEKELLRIEEALGFLSKRKSIGEKLDELKSADNESFAERLKEIEELLY